MAESAPTLHVPLRIERMKTMLLPDEPAKIILNELMYLAARKMSAIVLSEGYKSDQAIEEVASSARGLMQESFMGVIRREKAYSSDKYTPLHRRLAEIVGSDMKPEDVHVTVPETFFEEFAAAMRLEKKTFDHLQELRRHPIMETYILPLLRRLKTLDKDGQRMHEHGAEKAYALIKPLVGDARYTIPHAEAELLYFLTYIPTNVRFPAQDLLTHNMHMNFVQERRQAAHERSASTDMHDALLQGLAHGIFANKHWHHLSRYDGSSEKMNLELAREQVQFIATMKRLSDLVKDNTENAAVVDDFLSHLKDVMNRIDAMHHAHGCAALMLTDVGHCFYASELCHPLHDALNPKRNAKKYEKNGDLAAIMEDDPAQMSQWKNLVQGYSPFSLPADRNNTFAAPSEDFLMLADNECVSLFLIDIQNGADDTAGIRAAESLVERMIQKCIETDAQRQKGENARWGRQRQVIVWSASPALVEAAERHFAPLLTSERWKKYVTKQWSDGSRPISLDWQMKSGYISFRA